MIAAPVVAQVTCTTQLQLRRPAFTAVRPARIARTGRSRIAAAPRAQETKEVGTGGIAVAVAGLVANPIVDISAWTLFQTGSGLPPGPGGAYGAAEGVSYLVILAIIGKSIFVKVKTGSGLPAGPAGILGAAEGWSYLSLVLAVAAAGAQALK